MRAVFLDYDTVSNDDLDPRSLREAAGEVAFHEGTLDAQVAERIGAAEIVLLNKLRIGREVLESAPRLRLIALAGTGTNHIDLEAARERGVAVCNVRSYCSRSVAQQAWALALALNQHLAEYSRLATDGTWVRDERRAVLGAPIRELAGRIFGVVGYGDLGRATAGIAEAFGMHVRVANRLGAPPAAGRIDFDELLASADILSLHCPLTPATRGLIGARELALMKPDALLINTARGGLVDSAALAAALKGGRLGGAGLDVLPQEPPVDGDPLLDPAVPNLIVTPHVAWAAREARQRCLDEMAANIRDFRAGGRRGRVV